MSEHTPGPWETDNADSHCFGVFAPDGDAVAYLSENVFTGRGLRGQREDFANARILAAAPDLLEALRPFAALAEPLDDALQHDYCTRLNIQHADIRRAVAAIAKAEQKD